MLSETIREKRHQSRAFLILHMCFNIGIILDPALGGVLADPVRSWPGSVLGTGSGANGISGRYRMLSARYSWRGVLLRADVPG